ncbi:MAG: hypothetical protein AAGA86_11175 [Bacteroidota bacterium]
MRGKIIPVEAKDIRFPSSRSLDSSDAMSPKADYSAPYVTLKTIRKDDYEAITNIKEFQKFDIYWIEGPTSPDCLAISGSQEERIMVYADRGHEHFHNPLVIQGGTYMPPTKPG